MNADGLRSAVGVALTSEFSGKAALLAPRDALPPGPALRWVLDFNAEPEFQTFGARRQWFLLRIEATGSNENPEVPRKLALSVLRMGPNAFTSAAAVGDWSELVIRPGRLAATETSAAEGVSLHAVEFNGHFKET